MMNVLMGMLITAQYKGVSAECVIDVERKITSDTRGE